MARFSTGLRNALAVNYGLGIMMNAGVIWVYGGTMPLSPDLPPNTTLLGRITTGGEPFITGSGTPVAGLLLGHVNPGGLTNVGEWRLKGLASGTATWWRWCWSAPDPLAYSETLPRVDGTVGSELVLESPSITTSTNIEIERFLLMIGMG